MKKICLICLIVSIAFTLCSCNNSSYPIMSLDQSKIYYNGSVYYATTREHEFERYYEEKAVPETGERIGISIFLNTIGLFDYGVGDNILRVTAVGCAGFYFKEGFEFPKYNEVALSHLLIENRIIVEFPQERNVSWRNIIDYDTFIEIVERPKYDVTVYGEMKGLTLGEYFHTGFFRLAIIDDIAYIEIDMTLNRVDDPMVFYKISDEYQQIIKDAIAEYYEQYHFSA